MLLSDRDINIALEKGEIIIQGRLRRPEIQPCSVDVRLGNKLVICTRPSVWDIVRSLFDPAVGAIDPGQPNNYTKFITLEEGDVYYLRPWEMVLGATEEHVELSGAIAAKFEGKSSLGRLGLLVHLTAGYIDAGFRGTITTEIRNLWPWRSIMLRPGMKIGQLSFYRLSSPAARPYGHRDLRSKYSGQTDPQTSLMYLDRYR